MASSNEQSILESIGLEDYEARLYLILLRIGEASAVTLAKESGLHRRTVYDSLDKLQRKGLASIKIKKFVKHFAATSPETLLEKINEKGALLKNILPKLISQFKEKEKKVSVNIYEGAEGTKTVLMDALKECISKKEEIVMLGAGLKAPTQIGYSFAHYVDQLKKMRWRLIEPDTLEIKHEIKKWNADIQAKKYTRFLPEKYLSPLGLLAYSDRVVIMLMEEPVMIQIIGKKYAQAFKNYFELLWVAAKPFN